MERSTGLGREKEGRKILGISVSHNASAAVVDADSGCVLFCCSEERFTRRKNEWGLPGNVLHHIFQHVAPPSGFDEVVIGESGRIAYATRAFGALLNLEGYNVRDRLIQNKTGALFLAGREYMGRLLGLRRILRDDMIRAVRALGFEAPLRFVEHHEAHAAGAYYTSPFDAALVMTLDGEGDGLCASAWHGQGAAMTLAHTLPECMSPGLFYKSVVSILGLRVNRDEGKVTGLAARGAPERFLPHLRSFLEVACQGDNFSLHSPLAEAQVARLSRRSMDLAGLARQFHRFCAEQSWESLQNAILRDWFRALYRPHLPCDLARLGERDKADIAAAAQCLLEEAALAWLAHCRRLVPERDIVLGGGVFANVSLNRRILETGDTGRIHVYPPMGDEGLALGAAMRAYALRRETVSKPAPLEHFFLGPDIAPQSGDFTAAARDTSEGRISIETLAARVAEALAHDRIVGVARGCAEFGPRALGNRSILAHPNGREIAARLNDMLGRSHCMPFAPAVLDTHFGLLFPGEAAARARETCRYMTLALPVADAWKERIAGVVHADGTSRPQVAGAETTPFLHAVLRAFYQRTGLPCVLNTSFNSHGEPIVLTAGEALCTARRAGLDMLVLGDGIVELHPVAKGSSRVNPATPECALCDAAATAAL